MRVRVSLANGAADFRVSRDATLLEAALEAGLELPHRCKTGHCLACRARLVTGEIAYPRGTPLALGATEQAEGVVLMCLARARTDLTLELPGTTRADAEGSRRLPCRVELVQHLSPDVRGLLLRLPAAAPLSFQAGQHVDILIEGGRRRSFSIASPPHEPRRLELHVRRVNGGILTERLFEPGLEGRLLEIEGPRGHFRYRESHAPLLLVGGGTGLAPLKSMVRHVLENGLERCMHLYWGVRSERDLYAHVWLTDVARRHARWLDYRPVLSEPAAGWAGRRGLVHERVLEEIEDLAPYDVYASGPPAMIEAIQARFPAHGAERLYVDSFDFAPGSPARQRTSASSTD